MGKWRVAAAVLTGLLFASAVGVRDGGSGLFGRSPSPEHAATRLAISRTVDGIARPGRPIHILAESASVDRAVIDALGSLRHADATTLARDVSAIEEAALRGEVLAQQGGRQYLELLGFELESLPQPSSLQRCPWARVHSRLHCAEIRDDRWSPLPGVDYTGRLGVRLPPGPDGTIVLVIGDAVPLEIEAEDVDGMPVPIHTEVLRAGPASTIPVDFWLGEGNPWSAPGAVLRLSIEARPARDRLLSLRLGRRAPRVLARLRDYGAAARAHVCAAPLGIDDAFARATELVVLPDMPEYFGTGWYGPELGPPGLGTVRWMKGQGAVLVPSRVRGKVEIRLFGAAASEAATTLTLTVNDVLTTAPVPLTAKASSYRWTVLPPTWLAGTNELLFGVSRTTRASAHDTRDRGFALQRLELRFVQ
jgi:hypothetical protein